jgi:hypothetical protein
MNANEKNSKVINSENDKVSNRVEENNTENSGTVTTAENVTTSRPGDKDTKPVEVPEKNPKKK